MSDHINPDHDPNPIPELGDLAPEPGAGYWDAIDARLAAVEAEGSVLEVESPLDVEAEQDFSDTRDTEADVIRLDDMISQRHYHNGRRLNGQTMMAAAAGVLLLILGGLTLNQIIRSSDIPSAVEAAGGDGDSGEPSIAADGDVDDDPAADQTSDADTVEDPAGEDETGGGDGATSEDGQAAESSESSDETAVESTLPPGATCYADDVYSMVVVDTMVELTLDEAELTRRGLGSGSELRAYAIRNDGTFPFGAIGTYFSDAGYEASMFEIDLDGEITGPVEWLISPDEVFTAEEGDPGMELADCADIDNAQELYDEALALPSPALVDGDPDVDSDSGAASPSPFDNDDYVHIFVGTQLVGVWDKSNASWQQVDPVDGAAEFVAADGFEVDSLQTIGTDNHNVVWQTSTAVVPTECSIERNNGLGLDRGEPNRLQVHGTPHRTILPQLVNEISTTAEHLKAVSAVLDGVDVGPLALQAFQFDLEGDGVDEVLVEAVGQGADGAYSVLVLRRVGVDGTVENVAVHRSVAGEGEIFEHQVSTVVAIADINGDGNMDLATADVVFEAGGAGIWELTGTPTKVLSRLCGP